MSGSFDVTAGATQGVVNITVSAGGVSITNKLTIN
jgi:hypothetical protein